MSSEVKEKKTLEPFNFAIKIWQPENCLFRICKTYIGETEFI